MNALIIGAGGAGRIHARELTALGHTVDVYDMSPEKARALASRHPVTSVDSPEGDYDLSVVAVPASEHTRVIEDELARERRAVISEKPICLLPSEVERLRSLIASFETPLFIAESQCYLADDGLGVLRMRHRIDSGGLGQPVMWRVCAMTGQRPQPWFNDLAIGGGAFMEGGIHILTTARVIFGDACRWHGSVRSFLGGTGPDSGTFVIDYEAGHQLTLQIAWGTEGCFSGDCEPLRSSFGLFGPDHCLPWWPSDNHGLMWRHLLKCIGDDAEPVATVEHALAAVEDVWRCYGSAGIEAPE